MGIQEGKEHADHIFIEKVYDKILRERGMKREYDTELDRFFSVKDNRFMEAEGKQFSTLK